MRSALLLTFLAGALPAQAQITPEALWQRWQSGQGLVSVVEGASRPAGEGLVIDGAVLRLGAGETASRLNADGLRLELDGAMTRVVPPETWRLTGQDGTTADISAPGLDLRVSGAIEAPEYRVQQTDLAATGIIDAPDNVVDVAMDAAEFDLVVRPGNGGDLRADSLSLNAVPREEGQGRVAIVYEGLIAALRTEASGEEPADAGPPPYVLTTEASSSRQTLTAPLEEGGRPVTLDIASGPSRGKIATGRARVEARQSATALVLSVAGEEVPLSDARVDVGALTLSIVAPAEQARETAPVSVDLALTRVAPSEQIWRLLDPGSDLPREPGELRLALSGAMSWQADAGTPVPALEEASLDTLRLSALGAEIEGAGGVRFSPAATPERAGQPIGALAFTMTGLGALLDALEGVGTVQPGQLLGLRMGLGIFTRAGDGADVLETRIEFAPDGAVVVNGVPIARLP